MVSLLLTKYMLGAVVAQAALSIINSLFVLQGSDGVALALVGFFGLFHRLPSVLGFFALLEALSVAMDVIRLVLWSPFILNNVLQVPGTLGTFFFVLTVFSAVVKSVVFVFTLLIRKEIQDWLTTKSSTVHRNASFLPSFLDPGVSGFVERAAGAHSGMLSGARGAFGSFGSLPDRPESISANSQEKASLLGNGNDDFSDDEERKITTVNNSNNNNNNNNNNNVIHNVDKNVPASPLKKKPAENKDAEFRYQSFA